MSTEYPWESLQTATVAILVEHNGKDEIALVTNWIVGGLLSAGWKFNPQKDRDIADTGIREGGEETKIALFPGTGTFLDKEWKPTIDQEVIQKRDFVFPNGKKWVDTLYFFRLFEKPKFTLPAGVYFIDKEQYSQPNIVIDDKTYTFVAPDTREAILRIMK
jgi:hypothetical protein